MLYCAKCGTMYDLPMDALKRENDQWWARNRRECPGISCRGYVYDIDDEIIPIIDIIKKSINDADCYVNIVPLWSCSGHWYKETNGFPSIPYLTIAVLPDDINQLAPEEINNHTAVNQLRDFIMESADASKWSNLMIEVDDDTTCIHPLFADFDGDLHYPNEGWIPVTVRLDYNKMIERFHLGYDHKMPYRKYLDYVNTPVNRLARHGEYIKIFISEFTDLLHCIENFRIVKEDK